MQVVFLHVTNCVLILAFDVLESSFVIFSLIHLILTNTTYDSLLITKMTKY